jgi:negative regulator of sigma E activity
MSNDDHRGESLSALVDGEVEPGEIRPAVDRLLRDGAEQARWQRYFEGRALLEGIHGHTGDTFGERVCAALAEEPAIVAPSRATAGPARWRRPLVGMAMAASVAVVAAVGFWATGAGGPGGTERGVASDTETARQSADSVIRLTASGGADTTGAQRAQPELRRRLMVYLGNHNALAGSGGMPGVMPSTRLVGFNGSR